MARAPRHWLLKADPEEFGVQDLLASPGAATSWDGIRNYQARNFLREMAVGDLALVYHSNAEPSGVVGIAEVVAAAQADPTQFDRSSEYHEPRATQQAPIWLSVGVKAVRALPRTVSLEELRTSPECARMAVCRRGNRLSVTPVEPGEWRAVLALSKQKSAT